MKILVLRGGALGDFLLTLPAVAGLREKWPDAEIEMVTARRHGELVVGPRAVQAVRPMETTGLASFYAKRGNLDSEWADYFTEFDLTVSYLFDPDEIFSENWKRAGGTGEYVRHDPRNPRVAAWRHLAEPPEAAPPPCAVILLPVPTNVVLVPATVAAPPAPIVTT